MEALWIGVPCVLMPSDAMYSIYANVACITEKSHAVYGAALIAALNGELRDLRAPGMALARKHTFVVNARTLHEHIQRARGIT